MKSKFKTEWSEDRDAYLRSHYPNEPLIDVAEGLGLSPGVVKKRVDELGLKHVEGFNPFLYSGRYIRHYVHNPRKVSVKMLS